MSRRPTAKEVRARLSYDPETGLLSRKAFLDKGGRLIAKYAGRPVTTTSPAWRSYRMVTVCGYPQLVHRVIYLMMTGRWPKRDIDHVNGDRSDNRWVNLRVASRSQNCCNRGPAATNSSGYKGVSLCADTGLWRARIKFQQKQKCLGRYPTPEAAHAAYVKAARRIHRDYARV